MPDSEKNLVPVKLQASALSINRRSPVPLHRQLEAGLRGAILSGHLKPGDRVISSRELQTHLGLSRNTILDALAQLHAEGYLITRKGVGTFVAPKIHATPAPPARPERASAIRAVVPSRAAERFAEAEPYAANVPVAGLPFRPGLPAIDLFPWPAFKRSLGDTASDVELLDYRGPLGELRLRAAIARRLQQTRGVACDPENVLVTGGAQASFALIANVMLRAGDRVIVEEPGYPNMRAVLLAMGARTVPVRVDEAGIDTAALRKHPAKLAYITPSHQYPTGAVLALERRFELLDWASRNDAWIVEDDYDSEFNYTRRPHPALQGLDEKQRVIYAGTFSKILAPGLRVAYLVLPPALTAAFAAAQTVTGGSPSNIVQLALARFMEQGHLGRHIARMRRVYDERRRFAAEGFERLLGAGCVADTATGLHFIVHLPRGANDAALSRRATERGVALPALSRYYYGKPQHSGVVVGYSGATIAAARRALHTIGGLL